VKGPPMSTTTHREPHSRKDSRASRRIDRYLSGRKKHGSSTYDVTDSPKEPALLKHEPRLIQDPKRIKGVTWRDSRRWIGGKPLPLSGVGIPYFDRFGNNTSRTLAVTACDARSFVASSVATSTARLRAWAFQHNKPYVVIKNSSLLMKLGFLISHGNYYLARRCIPLLKNLEQGKRPLQGLLSHFLSKVGANIRFVYNHAVPQAKWFNLRAFRPRVKPAMSQVDKWRVRGFPGRDTSTIIEDSLWVCVSHISTLSP